MEKGRMKLGRWGRIATWSTALLIVAIVAVPFLVPVDVFLRQAEQRLADRLGDPVRIADGSLLLVPTPRVVIEGLEIGEPVAARVGRIVLHPDVSTIFDARKVLRDVRVESVALSRDALPRLRKWMASPPADGPSTVQLRALTLAGITAEFLPFGALEAEVGFGTEGAFDRATVRTGDGGASLTVTPSDGRFAAVLAATAWRIPGNAALTIETLEARALVSEVDADITALSGSFYGGTFQGKGVVDWRKGILVRSTLRGEGVDLAPLLSALNASTRLSGRLTADVRLAAQATDAAGLSQTLRVQATFSIADGVLEGVDLVEAAKSMVGVAASGGRTRFDRFSGTVTTDGRSHRLRRLDVSSGMLHATGQIDVSPSQDLDGRIDAELKAGVSLLKVPLRVLGTVTEPRVAPTAAGVAGAVAGAALGGPVGGSVGARAGAFFDRLFRRDSK